MRRLLPVIYRQTRSFSITPVRPVKIYTKTGDTGESSLFSFTGAPLPRRAKNDQIFKTLGDIDELNANVGNCAAFCRHDPMLDELQEYFHNIQCDLIEVGSCVAFQLSQEDYEKCQNGEKIYPDFAKFNKKLDTAETKFLLKVEEIETWIDSIDDHLQPLTSFILPAGGRSATQAHVTRAICRRAERSIIDLKVNEMNRIQNGELSSNIDQLNEVQVYLNRLSDFFFNVARFVIARQGDIETEFSPRKPRPTQEKIEDSNAESEDSK